MDRCTALLTKPDMGSQISCVRQTGWHKLILSYTVLASTLTCAHMRHLCLYAWTYTCYECTYGHRVSTKTMYAHECIQYGYSLCAVYASTCVYGVCASVCFYIMHVYMYKLYRDMVNKHASHLQSTHMCTYVHIIMCPHASQPSSRRWRICRSEYRPSCNCVILGKSVDSFGFTLFFVWLERDQL